MKALCVTKNTGTHFFYFHLSRLLCVRFVSKHFYIKEQENHKNKISRSHFCLYYILIWETLKSAGPGLKTEKNIQEHYGLGYTGDLLYKFWLPFTLVTRGCCQHKFVIKRLKKSPGSAANPRHHEEEKTTKSNACKINKQMHEKHLSQ